MIPFRRQRYRRLNCLLLLLFLAVRGQESEEILDTTSSSTTRPVLVNLPDFGRIQGKRQGGIDFFGGLPYAAPPCGSRRWAPPEPPAPWAPAKLDATHFGPDCWQLSDPVTNPLADHMSEDCLYLNVFTPAGQSARYHSYSSSSLLPVMVWLHGGAFQQGGARRPEYDGRRLAERGTIVVTLNYRLGALGFLVSSPDGLFGNFGLMDQRAALRWVKDNIRQFGGDPDNITVFGESAGAVMTVLHLLMEGAGTLFHKAIVQSNPLGLQFRSVVVADFIGEALKHSVDCRDLACLRAERVEEIMRAQSSLMGVPRSVGDFFTWGPTLTEELKVTLGAASKKQDESSPMRRDQHGRFRDLDFWKWQSGRDASWSAVNVTQPLKNLHLIPDNVPVLVGANKHEGEMFVHGAFPITMSKAVYWMFVGALFRDSASRVLKHYRGYVDQLEREAKQVAKKQIEEEESRQFYLDHQEDLDREYRLLLELNASASSENDQGGANWSVETLLETWSRGGAIEEEATTSSVPDGGPWYRRLLVAIGRNMSGSRMSTREMEERHVEKMRLREERKRLRAKERALREAAKVVVDYRPVMSRIIDDYLFRCPAWHLAHHLSRNRLEKGLTNNVYVYRFSHSTHIPGFKECWGKACHTAELPYVFQAMDAIRSNYSTLGPYAQAEAPAAPEYPYTDILAAYRELVQAFQVDDEESADEERPPNGRASAEEHGKSTTDRPSYANDTTSSAPHAPPRNFQRRLQMLFGDYFKEDADEEIASDMADRWVAFARTGDPNYDSSRATWKPWRYVFDHSEHKDGGSDATTDDQSWIPQDYDKIFDWDDDDDEEAEAKDEENGHVWSSDPQERTLRRRALKTLGMQIIEEDVFQTMLVRSPRSHKRYEEDHPLHFLFGSSKSKQLSADEERIRRRAKRQLQQIAQDMGLLGRGLAGGPRSGASAISGNSDEDFFPEILELKWPPEGRLVERDCTCDMWDRIRYRY